MRNPLIAFAVLLLSVSALAQAKPVDIPDGVKLPVELVDGVDITKLKVGDDIRMKVTKSLLGPDKAVVIPKDAIAHGRVLGMELAAKDKPSKLRFLVERVTWKAGEVPMHAYIASALTAPGYMKLEGPTDVSMIGIAAHTQEGSVLYCRKNIRIPGGTGFTIEQTTKPGPSFPPAW